MAQSRFTRFIAFNPLRHLRELFLNLFFIFMFFFFVLFFYSTANSALRHPLLRISDPSGKSANARSAAVAFH